MTPAQDDLVQNVRPALLMLTGAVAVVVGPAHDVASRHAARDVRALDVGCGEGWLTRELVRLGAHATGVDGSAPLVDAARAAGGGADYACVSYAQLEADTLVVEGPFDLIVCNFALLDDRVTHLLTALARRLPSSGVILVQTVHPWAAVGEGPYADGWRTEHWGAFDVSFPAPMPWYFRTVGSWIAAAREARLVVDRLEESLHPDTRKPLSLLLELA